MHLYTNGTDVYAARDRADLATVLSGPLGFHEGRLEAADADQIEDDKPVTCILDTAALPLDPVDVPDGGTVMVQGHVCITATAAQWAAWAAARGDSYENRLVASVNW